MSECIDKRFEKMISAFELDVLTDEEKREFSVHLMECEHCFEKARKFKNEARILKRDPEFRKEVLQFTEKQLDEDEDSLPETEVIVPWWKRQKKYIPAIAVAAAILIILVFKPWHIEFQPTKEVIASENRLAIMYFDNVVEPDDPQHLGEIAANLLISDLSESSYMQVVSSHRLYDVLKLIGKEGLKKIDKEIALEVARKADARWMLTGNILQDEPQLIISSVLIEVSTGDVQASQKVTGDEGDNIFALIDKLTVKVKQDLSLPEAALQEPDRPVAEVTTQSQEAYQYYLEGVEYNQKYYILEAVQSFEKALEYDSTFAMAYFQLASLKDKDLIHKAVEYIDHVGQIDRYYIEALEAEISGDNVKKIKLLKSIIEKYPDEKNAYYSLALNEITNGRYDKANEYLNEAVKIDPLFKTAYNLMVYNYDYIGDFEKALWAIDKYIEIAPDEANPYDTKADLYASNGMIENAAKNYRTAIKIKPDYYSSSAKLGLLYIYQGDYQKADSCLDAVLALDEDRYQHLVGIYRCYILLIQGKFNQGLELIDHPLGKPEDGEQQDEGDDDEQNPLDGVGARLIAVKSEGETASALQHLETPNSNGGALPVARSVPRLTGTAGRSFPRSGRNTPPACSSGPSPSAPAG